MSAHTVCLFGRSLAQRLALPLILLTPVACDSQPVAVSRVIEPALGAREPRVSANSVIHWHAVASKLLVDLGPVIDSRAFAILHVAMHDAVNGIERRFEPYTLAERPSVGASLDAAVATAARDVLVALTPSHREQIEREYAAALGAVPSGPAKDRGVNVGQRSAQANLARRANDSIPVGPWPPQSGPITQPPYVPNGKPGDYAFTPPFDQPPLGPIALFPGWGRLTPFGTDLAKHELPGPDALTSAAYARDLASVKSLGSLNSRTRTVDQTEIAFFWFEGNAWHEIGRGVLEQVHADEWQAARTLALTYLAVADAGIACFEAKYRFRFCALIRRSGERTRTAIRPRKPTRTGGHSFGHRPERLRRF